MAKNRKEHRKQCRLKGERAKAERTNAIAQRLAHTHNVETLRRVLDHTERLRRENPQLFADVMKTVDALAVESGVTREEVLANGIVMEGEDGQLTAKSPSDILREIAEARAHISARLAAQGTESAGIASTESESPAPALA